MLIGVFQTTGFQNCVLDTDIEDFRGREMALGVHQFLRLRDSKTFGVGRRRWRWFHDSCGLEGVAITCFPYERDRNC